ncbi:MAG: acryloyl-CoA reductase [Betaproteobacteria bacterium]|nr:acryloyl-CoA reductase [Betaproteobacteria bacterium]
MTTFKVVRLHNENGHRVSRLEESRLDDLDPGDVVIRSQYAAVNYKDARAVTGVGNVVKRLPCIPGIEVGGIVASSKSPKFREGDVVTVQGGAEFGIRHDGAYSEFVRVPAEWVYPVSGGFDSFSVVALGIAAYTAAVAVEELIAHGVSPDKGKVAVTGATGGCASFVIDMLAGLGFHVVAVTGKPEAAGYLRELGAKEIIGRDAIAPGAKALETQLWAGAIDAVGGKPLDDLLRTMNKRGVVCAYGNAAGENFTTSIYPFILRSVQLVGVNANHPVGLRGDAWRRLAGDLRPRNLDRIVTKVSFAELPAYCERVIAGGIRGRGVLQF